MKTKVLITVKTYPTLSLKYLELVCTAGMLEDGSWIRIYPLPYRRLDYANQFKKYQWIELDLMRNMEKDFRPESHKPVNVESIRLLDRIEPDGDAWHDRRKYCTQKVYHSLGKLINEAYSPSHRTSLATFKPAKVLDFKWEADDRAWDPAKLRGLEELSRQGNLFDQEHLDLFKVTRKLPYKFRYKFMDSEGKVSNMMIEDWELGELYWQMVARYGDEAKACAKVKEKFMDDLAMTKDLHFFLGTTFEYHQKKAPNPFMIVGVFYPKHITQPRLF